MPEIIPDDIPQVDQQIGSFLTVTESTDRQPTPNPRFIEALQVFNDELQPKINLVYYPCCYTDNSPSLAFPQTRVVYVDTDSDAIKALTKAGYEAYAQSALKFQLDTPADVLILTRPGILPNIPTEQLTENGYLICDEGHQTATNTEKLGNFKLVGIIKEDINKKPYFVSRNLDDHWQNRRKNVDDLFIFQKIKRK